jgi:DNA primase
MKFSQEFIERVSEANNIVDIISQYTQLKPAGGGFMGRCPFPDHPEKTPSFSVSELKQVYHCFGCHKKETYFHFFRTIMACHFAKALNTSLTAPAFRCHRSTRRPRTNKIYLHKKKRLLSQANRLALQYYRENFRNLPAQHPAKIYVQKRGLKSETLETFQVGYANEEWDGLVLYLEKNKVSMQIAEEARLIKARTGGKSGYFDLFRERLIFPIFSAMNEPIAFGGRILVNGEPKYLNSPETALFHKGRVLYGLSETAKFIRTEDQAIVVEGYMDLVSLYQNQIQNVVATMGTALTMDHGKMLSRMTQNVVVLFDGDQAGQTAAERSLPLYWPAMFTQKV